MDMYVSRNTPFTISASFFALATNHQPCNSARATDGQGRYNLSLHYAYRPIFERLFVFYPETIFSHFLFLCEFKTILTLRLVSKTINDLVLSIKTSISHSPLNDKAFIYCYYPNLYLQAKPEVQEKIHFAQQYKANIDIAISISDLPYLRLVLNSLPETRLSLILIIENLEELHELDSLILSQTNSSFFNKIRSLNLSRLEISKNTVGSIFALFDNAAQNPSLFSNLKNLSFGNVDTSVKFILSKEFPNLLTLSFECIHNFWKLDLSESSFPRLTSLSFKEISYAAKLVLPKVLPSLLKLSCTRMYSYARLDLSTCYLPNLASLVFGYICCDAELILHLNQLPSLKHLEYKDDDRYLSDCLPLLYLELKLAIKSLIS